MLFVREKSGEVLIFYSSLNSMKLNQVLDSSEKIDAFDSNYFLVRKAENPEQRTLTFPLDQLILQLTDSVGTAEFLKVYKCSESS